MEAPSTSQTRSPAEMTANVLLAVGLVLTAGGVVLLVLPGPALLLLAVGLVVVLLAVVLRFALRTRPATE